MRQVGFSAHTELRHYRHLEGGGGATCTCGSRKSSVLCQLRYTWYMGLQSVTQGLHGGGALPARQRSWACLHLC